eukprot:SAG22_NODE_790_length_7216_cov_5.198820_6_plen_109_part_00
MLPAGFLCGSTGPPVTPTECGLFGICRATSCSFRQVFNRKDPIIFGVEVTAGQLRVGTPICIPSRDFLELGRVGGARSQRASYLFTLSSSALCLFMSTLPLRVRCSLP